MAVAQPLDNHARVQAKSDQQAMSSKAATAAAGSLTAPAAKESDQAAAEAAHVHHNLKTFPINLCETSNTQTLDDSKTALSIALMCHT